MPELSQASAAAVGVACIGAAAVAFVVGVAITALIRRLAVRHGVRVKRRSIWRAPLAWLLAVLAVRGVLLAADAQGEWAHRVEYVLGLAAIAIVGWLLTGVAVGVERTLLSRYPDAGLEDRRSRHVRTKIILVARVTQAAIVAITVAAMLWTIPPLRDISVGIFASAGVIGLVVGLAAQTTLGNLFAGLQIAFTDAIRIDDIVVIGAQRGRIEEITLTYVAARLRDNTTMILPCTYFTTTPFQNWTHKSAQIKGVVEIAVTSSASLDSLLEALRAELTRILQSSPHWDRQQGDLHVEDAIGPTVKLVAVVTAIDGDAIEPLRREVREGLLTFLQRDYPEALPGGPARRPSA